MSKENIFKAVFFPSEQTVENVYAKIDKIIDKLIPKDSKLRKFATPAIIVYLFVGGATTFINLAVYYLLYFLLPNPSDSILTFNIFKIPVNISLEAIFIFVIDAIAWLAAVVACFYPNKFYVFRSAYQGKAHTWKEFISFVGSRLATLIMELIGFYIFCSLLNFSASIIKLVLAVLVVIGNYVLGKLWVFGKKKN